MTSGIQRSARKAVAHVHGRGGGRTRDQLGQLAGVKGIAAGAGAAVLVPLAVRGVSKLSDGVPHAGDLGDLMQEARERVSESPASRVADAIAHRGDGAAAILGQFFGEENGDGSGPLRHVLDALPLGGNDEDENSEAPPAGVGKGRRMPVQQSVDIGAPIAQVYNHWIRYEDWPSYMHRVVRATQEDETTVSFAVKIWGKTKEFTAEIETQRPTERVKWRATQGMTHTGVVSFHELGPNLTRVLLGLDIEPAGLMEKAARGMRHVKRAARGDLHRFKAMVEMSDEDADAWPGTIEDGEVASSGRGGRGASSTGRAASARDRSNGRHRRAPGSGSGGSNTAARRQQARNRNGHGR